jgi:hypothetical protein
MGWFLTTIDKTVPEKLDIHFVCDNYGTHKTPAIKAWLARHPRVHMHFTPTGSSWCRPSRPTSAPGSPLGTRTPTVRVEEDRRGDPRFAGPISTTDFRRRTLASLVIADRGTPRPYLIW